MAGTIKAIVIAALFAGVSRAHASDDTAINPDLDSALKVCLTAVFNPSEGIRAAEAGGWEMMNDLSVPPNSGLWNDRGFAALLKAQDIESKDNKILIKISSTTYPHAKFGYCEVAFVKIAVSGSGLEMIAILAQRDGFDRAQRSNGSSKWPRSSWSRVDESGDLTLLDADGSRLTKISVLGIVSKRSTQN